MWQLDQWRCEYLKNNLYKLPDDLDTSKLSADEVHYRTIYYKAKDRDNPFSPRREVKFITNLVCASVSKVIANYPGRDEKSLRKCFQQLSSAQLSKVSFISVDMNAGYFAAI